MDELIKSLVKNPLLFIFVAGIITLLIGLGVIEIYQGSIYIKATGLHQNIILSVAGGMPALVILFLFAWEMAQNSRVGKIIQRRKYDKELKKGNIAALNQIQLENSLSKLKSTDISEVMAGVEEIESLGASQPFEAGFNALARELARRRHWLLKLKIVDALGIIVEPIREQYKE